MIDAKWHTDGGTDVYNERGLVVIRAETPDIAQLAACAPEMARWMLALRTAVQSEGTEYEDSPFWSVWGPEIEDLLTRAGVLP